MSVFERYNAPYTEELKPFVEAMLNKRVVVKLHVTKTVTWDHRKLGLSVRMSSGYSSSDVRQRHDAHRVTEHVGLQAVLAERERDAGCRIRPRDLHVRARVAERAG